MMLSAFEGSVKQAAALGQHSAGSLRSVAYVELHTHSYFSLLDGASSPEQLVARAAELGYRALALTDHNGLSGAVRFYQAARNHGLQAIIGAEVSLDDGHHLTLLAESQGGYANLCRMISMGQLAGEKGQPVLTMEIIARHAEGLICLSGCARGAIASALQAGDSLKAQSAAQDLRDVFAGRLWVELQRHYGPQDLVLSAALIDLARHLELGCVATNNVHYADCSRQYLHDVLTCVRAHTTLPEALAAGVLDPNSELYLKSSAEMGLLFQDIPEALSNTCLIAERCHVDLDFSRHQVPSFSAPDGHSHESYLRVLCEEGFQHKFSWVSPQARAQLEHELGIIERAGLCGYFLVVWDVVRFARAQGIRHQGRGSAANSLVAYVLGITPVDPLRYHLLFERFLSEGTRTMPDIDVDFAADRREEVIQYVYRRYGHDHVAMVCNVVTFRARSAVRDVAKALGFPADVIDRTAKALDVRSPARAAAEIVQEDFQQRTTGPDRQVALPWHLLAELLGQMDGVPRHLSIHVGGMLITAAPLVEIVPVERATMPGRVVVQWDKDSVEDAGLIKIDLLSLRTLDAVEEAWNHVRHVRGIELDLDNLPMGDPAVFNMLQQADTIGCFQVESRAQSQMLPRLKPACFEDIIVEVALVRPGPIQGNMVHPYLRRRQGLEPVTYVHPALKPILDETLGVILFQEQVIRVAVAVAGFDPAEADRLRRAMSRSRSEEAMAALRDLFVAGAVSNGVEAEAAQEVFRQLAGFAEFGFCKSHAAAFALVAYQTLYLKLYHPAEYFCGLLNHQPMGFYMPEVLMGDVQRHGVPVLRPDIHRSEDACTLELHEDMTVAMRRPASEERPPGRTSGKRNGARGKTLGTVQDACCHNGSAGVGSSRRAIPASTGVGERLAIRLGFRYVQGLGEVGITRLVEERERGAYRHLHDLCRRTRLPKSVVENLIRAGVLDSFDGQRRDLLWELGGLSYSEEGLDLQAPLDPVELPLLRTRERLNWEYELLGLAPGEHVMQLYRKRLSERGVLSKNELELRRDGDAVQVAGWMVIRQRPPTAKGHVFITLEDEEGLINLIVRPGVYERYRDVLRTGPLLWAEGRLQREGAAQSVLVHRAALLSDGLSEPHDQE